MGQQEDQYTIILLLTVTVHKLFLTLINLTILKGTSAQELCKALLHISYILIADSVSSIRD